MQSKNGRRSRHPIGYFGVSSLRTLQVQRENESTARIDFAETSPESSTKPEKHCLQRESLISVHRNKTHVL